MVEVNKWIKKVEKQIQSFRDLKPTDRLEFVSALKQLNEAVAASTVGWDSWIKNPEVMKVFKQEELSELFDSFRELAIKFLELDIKYSREFLNKTKTREKKSFYTA